MIQNERSHNIVEDLAEMIAARVVELLREKGSPSQHSIEPCQNELPTLYTIEEVCEILKISKPTLDRHRKDGYIKASHYVGRSPRFTTEDVHSYLKCFKSDSEFGHTA